MNVSSAMDKLGKSRLLFTQFYQDMVQYLRYSGISPFQDAQKRRFYKLLIEAHALEKGLSLANPRAMFGRSKIDFLMAELDRYDADRSALPVQKILGVLETYSASMRARGETDPYLDRIDAFVAERRADFDAPLAGGLRHFDVAYQELDHLSPEAFLASRFSNRAFAPDRVPLAEIEAAVRTAQTAPSQCNRQATHAHFFQDPDRILALLRLQGGSAGFQEEVRNLFVISSELAAWGGAQQRNQLYVDGALFAMALMYGLHARHIAACPLNLAVTNKREQEIRDVAGIPADQRLIMMIAVGYPMRTTAVHAARSPRRDIGEVLRIVP